MATTTKRRTRPSTKRRGGKAAHPAKAKGATAEGAITVPAPRWVESRAPQSGGPAEFEVFVTGDPASKKEQALGEKLVDDAADPSDVKRLCDAYDIRREDLARLTGFSLRALADWSAGKLPSEPAKRRLHEIRRLLDSLAEVVKIEAIPAWLKKRNPAFNNMTPLQVIEVGEIDRLWQMVYAMGSHSLA